MQDCLVHRPYHYRDKLFEDSSICASRVHLDTVRDGSQPFGSSGVFVWLDGEMYNKEEFGDSELSEAHLLLQQHRNNTLVPFLKKIDGIFAAVIYDQNKKTITIVNDRYGLRYLYISRSAAGCVWASELKAFRCLPSCSVTADREAASIFFTKGYLTGNRTWFRDIELLAPATMITVKCDTNETSVLHYLDWMVTAEGSEANDLPELARELGNRFIRAVDRRCRVGERIGIGLSGGLDSRAIFAAMPLRCEPLRAYTFGAKDSEDLRIAHKITTLRPSKHLTFEIASHNWLKNRIDAVWLTDGQFNLLHMHGVEHGEEIREQVDIQLNGFLSDTIVDACYENQEGKEILKYYDHDRRFIAMGIVLANDCVISRLPFFDNALMELTMSIPRHYRRNSLLYHRMLLTTFPSYYQDIPWQATGMPISRKSPIDKVLRLARKCAGRLQSMFSARWRSDSFTDYPSWIRQSPAREFFFELLTNKNALIFDFVDPALIRRYLNRHLRGLNCAERIGRYATFELWLRRFYG